MGLFKYTGTHSWASSALNRSIPLLEQKITLYHVYIFTISAILYCLSHLVLSCAGWVCLRLCKVAPVQMDCLGRLMSAGAFFICRVKKNTIARRRAMVLILYEENEALLAATAGSQASEGKQGECSRGRLGD